MVQSLIIKEYINPGILILKIFDPPFNLISDELLLQLKNNLIEIQKNKDIRCVVITSDIDNIFSAGANVNEFPKNIGEGKKRSQFRHAVYNMIENLAQPTIAALNGNAFGGGLELALACDFRVAIDNAKFGLTELRFGLFPAGGGTFRLARIVGEPSAKEMIYFHRVISSHQAQNIRLVNEVTTKNDFWVMIMDMAKQLASQSPMALQSAKKAINLGCKSGKSASERAEELLIDEIFVHGDVQEGISAFFEKRNPNFITNSKNSNKP